MKKFSIILPFLLLVLPGFSDVNFGVGVNAGVEQNIYDAKEESFKAKFQYGGGFNPYLLFVFNNLIGIEFGFPGFFYTFSSDTLGNYYYPEKIKIPWKLKLLALIKYEKLNFEIGGGGELPYYIIASYYSPRYLLSGVSIFAGLSYQLTERLSSGIRFENAFYFDEYSSLNDSIYYLFSLCYRIF